MNMEEGTSEVSGNAGSTKGKGRRKKEPPRNPINLRPCEVCGAKASGIHFGAITCEACKVRRVVYITVT